MRLERQGSPGKRPLVLFSSLSRVSPLRGRCTEESGGSEGEVRMHAQGGQQWFSVPGLSWGQAGWALQPCVEQEVSVVNEDTCQPQLDHRDLSDSHRGRRLTLLMSELLTAFTPLAKCAYFYESMLFNERKPVFLISRVCCMSLHSRA